MRSPRDYTEQREKLIFQLLSAAGIAATFLPDRLDPKSEFAAMGGMSHDNHHVKAVSDAIQDAMYFFDRMQEAVGLRDPRMTRFDTKRLDSNGQPDPDFKRPPAMPRRERPKPRRRRAAQPA